MTTPGDAPDGDDADGHDDPWSAVAVEWAAQWGAVADPARRALLTAAGVGPNTRVLDVGCGSGELPALVTRLGAVAAGLDSAPGMVRLARAAAPGADVRVGDAEDLPWPDASMDVVLAVNTLQLVDDPVRALAEAVRVTVPGGHVGLAGWAAGARDDLGTVQAALAALHGDPPPAHGAAGRPGGLERLLREAGLGIVAAGTVPAPWDVADDDALVRGVLLGEDADGLAAGAATVLAAARPFRRPDGGFRLVGSLRWAVARRPGAGPGERPGSGERSSGPAAAGDRPVDVRRESRRGR